MKIWKAIWAALVSFFAALRGREDSGDIQDQIQQETQEVIDEVPQMSDDELDALAESTGLLQRDSKDGSPSRAERLDGPGNSKDWTKYWGKTPSKTNDKPDS